MVGAGALAGLCAPATAFAANVHKVIVVMKEFSFTPAKIELKVGETVELTPRNTGQVAHDWMAGDGLVNTPDEKGFRKDLVALLKPEERGRKFTPERVGVPSKADGIKRVSTGAEIEPGGEVSLHFTVPADAKGTWTVACVLTGHYESGMKGTIVIR
jgi:plastocyanin